MRPSHRAGALVAVLVGSLTVLGSLAPTAQAAPHGGSGGSPFTLSCGANEVLVAIGTRSGSLVDKVEALCQRIDSGKKWASGGASIRGSAGGSGGSPGLIACDRDSAIIGLHGRSGALVDRLGAICRKVDGTGSAYDRNAVGGSGGTAFRDACPGGQVGVGLRGRSGALIDQIELICGAVPAAAPGPMTVTLRASPASGALSPCTGVVRLTAQVSGGPSGTTYKFGVGRGNEVLQESSSFITSSTVAWPSVGSGLYRFWVTARRSGAPDARAEITGYTVPLPLTLSASPTSPAPAPSAVTLTAAVSPASCQPRNTTMRYQFGASPGGGGSTRTTPTWTTGQLQTGTYTLTLIGVARMGDTDIALGTKSLENYRVGGTTTSGGTTTTGGATTAVSFNELYGVYSHVRCVNCHGRADPITSGRNHGAVGAVGASSNCTSCHSGVADWKVTGAPSFWAGSGTATTAKSASEICNTVKNSAIAASRQSFLQHVGTDVTGATPATFDARIKWAFSPTDPVGAGGAVSSLSYADFGKKSMQWFDNGKPCP